jgi:hypothetical protein
MPFHHLLLPLNQPTTKLDMTSRSFNVLGWLLVRDHRFDAGAFGFLT